MGEKLTVLSNWTAVAVLVGGLPVLGCGGVADETESEAIGVSTSTIVNGLQTCPGGGQVATTGCLPELEKAVAAYEGTEWGICSGLLLRPRWVVTAAHCVWQTPITSFCVRDNIANRSWDNRVCSDIAQVYIAPGGVDVIDMALVRLSNGNLGSEVAQVTLPFSGLDPFEPWIYEFGGPPVLIGGYGPHVASSPPNEPHPLTFQWATMDQFYYWFEGQGHTEVFRPANPTHANIDYGDSGGPALGTATFPYTTLGATSAPHTIGSPEGALTGIASSRARDYRQFAAETMALNLTYSFDFGSSAHLSSYLAKNVGGGSWSVGSGRLRQTANVSRAMRILSPTNGALDAIYDNLQVSVRIRSADDDEAGIVFRYADGNHYYFAGINEQRDYLRLVKRTPAGDILLAAARWTGDEANWTTMRVTALMDQITLDLFDANDSLIDVISVRDHDYPAGEVGLIANWNVVDFDDFSAVARTDGFEDSAQPQLESMFGWKGWFDADNPSGTGDYEPVDYDLCGGGTPIAIQARVKGTTTLVSEPADVITLTPDLGLTCVLADQPDSACADYEIRYHCRW